MYLFTPESLLPEGVGFTLFGPVHLAVLTVLAGISAGVIFIGLHIGQPNRQRMQKVMAGSMLGMEVAKDLILGGIGAFSVGYLPLHLCSLCMFLCLFCAWHPASRTGGALVWCLCLSGGLSALLFPDWTHFPIYHFQSLHSFLYHAMLVQFSLLCFCSGDIRPGLRDTWRVMGFLLAAAVVVYLLNTWLHTNYMFLMHPLPGTPLAFCASLPGGYLFWFGILALVLVALLLALAQLCQFCTRRKD